MNPRSLELVYGEIKVKFGIHASVPSGTWALLNTVAVYTIFSSFPNWPEKTKKLKSGNRGKTH